MITWKIFITESQAKSHFHDEKNSLVYFLLKFTILQWKPPLRNKTPQANSFPMNVHAEVSVELKTSI